MRVLLWHGWLLEGSGSNVYTARVTEVLRRRGHDVLVLCQELEPNRFSFVDRWGTVGPEGVGELHDAEVAAAPGRATFLRPKIGRLLPVFVLDEYEGFDAKRFVDLTEPELDTYLQANIDALRVAAAWHRPEVVVAGHVVPGLVVARRALGAGTYVAKVHGSDIEYAARLQPRYADLAAEGLEGAVAVVGATRDVLGRALALCPTASDRTRVVTPGVDVDAFRPRPRREALHAAAARLAGDPTPTRPRTAAVDDAVAAALATRDAASLDELARSYDQAAPDADAAGRLRVLADHQGPIVGYIGKFIPQKGVELLLAALTELDAPVRGLVVGFGTFREWLTALTLALDAGDGDAVGWLRSTSALALEPSLDVVAAAGIRRRVTFTGRLDHRYAPEVVAAMDVLVVPSVLEEAFGMVAAEGAAAGALPLVARHSGLAEIAAALEDATDRPGLFSYEPGPGSPGRIASGIRRLLGLPAQEAAELRRAVAAYSSTTWTWERTAQRLLAAGMGTEPSRPRPSGAPSASRRGSAT